MSAPPVRYRSHDEDSGRWIDFPFRDGDIVISTRSKSGTTWMQMICALLVFQTPELPEPLTMLSPWLDWLVEPRDVVVARLDAQRHRRFIKTHTPLDGIVLDARATYIVVARHPLDMAVSLYHHSGNIDRARLRELTGQHSVERAPLPLHDWVVAWAHADVDPREQMDSLPGVMWHLADAWARRNDPNIVLVHYDDLQRDLDGAMRRLAARLGFTVADDRWADLVRAASFSEMRARAQRLAPDALGVLKDRDAFFRRGTSGAAREVLSDAELEAYQRRALELAPSDLLEWLHR